MHLFETVGETAAVGEPGEGIGGGRLFEALDELLEFVVLVRDLVDRLGEGVAEPLVLALHAREGEVLLDGDGDRREDLGGLEEVVGGADADGLEERLDVRLGGHDDDREPRAARLDGGDHIEGVAVGQVVVAQREVVAREVERFEVADRRDMVHARPAEVLGEDVSDERRRVGVVLDDEDARDGVGAAGHNAERAKVARSAPSAENIHG